MLVQAYVKLIFLPKSPTVVVCVSAECESRRLLCDGDKLSLENKLEVALLSVLLTSSVAAEL